MSESTRRPLIGITGRRLSGRRLPHFEPRYQVRDVYVYFGDYARCLAEADCIPVQLPYEVGTEVLEDLDGLLVTGGEDVCPILWGGSEDDAAGHVNLERDTYELDLINAALAADVPMLGVCRGMQLINVARGGTLVPHLDTSAGIDHQAPGQPVETIVHRVSFVAGTAAFGVYGHSRQVNSLHHQAVDRPGEGVAVSGRSDDGTAETLEIPGRKVLGVQWHPEWMPTPDRSFKWLTMHASARRRLRTASSVTA